MVYSSKLTNIINISQYENSNEVINSLYDYFSQNILNKDKRPELFGSFIYIDCNNWIDYKSELFWHLISLNQNEKFNILPCTNCITIDKCPENCIYQKRVVTLSNGEKRNICLYRGVRLNWINEILKLANSKDENIKCWEKEKFYGNKKKEQKYVRFTHNAVDYVVVLEKIMRKNQFSHYQLVTAFPVMYISKKQEFEKDYAKYISEQNKNR